jgi:hypothetical protein
MDRDVCKVFDEFLGLLWTACPFGLVEFESRKWTDHTDLSASAARVMHGRRQFILRTCTPSALMLLLNSPGQAQTGTE